jgi:hypothetical protein
MQTPLINLNVGKYPFGVSFGLPEEIQIGMFGCSRANSAANFSRWVDPPSTNIAWVVSTGYSFPCSQTKAASIEPALDI